MSDVTPQVTKIRVDGRIVMRTPKKRAPAPPPVCDLERLRAACAVAHEIKALDGNRDIPALFAHVEITPDAADRLGLPCVRVVACLRTDDDALLERLFARVAIGYVRDRFGSTDTPEYMHGKVDDVLVFLEGNGLVAGLMQHGPGACREAVTP